MARLVGLEAGEVDRIERGEATVAFTTLERYATAFGTRPSGFIEGAALKSPATLLFRSATDLGTDLGSTLAVDDVRVLGDFLACAQDVHELGARLGDPAPSLPELASADLSEPEWQQGREFAERTRQALGLGTAPIPSMTALLGTRMGWSLFFVTPEQLSPTVQGASTIVPRPAILINLVDGVDRWWSTRVSLAHEMCHVLFDSRTSSRPYLISPQGDLVARRQWAIVERFRGLERRANAFAVHLLAPRAGIQELVGRRPPDAEPSIKAVCDHFGIGRTVAIRRLGHVYDVSQEAQDQLIERGSDTARADIAQHPDAAVIAGLRRGVLADLVERAFRANEIGATAARAYLDIPLSEPLPGAGPGRGPLVTKEQVARSRAEAHMRTSGVPGCWSSEARQTDDGWEVDMRCPRADGVSVEKVHLSASFEPISR